MNTNKDLAKRLSFKENKVFLDGDKLLEVQGGSITETTINLIGVLGNRELYVGTGVCCYGYIVKLSNFEESEKPEKFRQSGIRVPNFNVDDIIPAVVDTQKK